MNKTLYAVGLYLFLIILISCSSPAPLLQSNWQDKPVKVDGKATEWTIPLQYYDNDTKLNYVISNDDSNLYYCFRITDDKEQMRVMRVGMQFWIDTTGKNQQQVGIQFPFPQLSAMAESNENQSGYHHHTRTDSSTAHGWTGKPNEMRLTGFLYPISGVTPMPNIYGIKVSIARDSTGVTIYEASIPFKTFYKSVLTSADNNKALGITIILNPMQSEHSNGGSHHGGGSGMGGPGGMGIRGMGGGGIGGGGYMGGGGHHSRDEDEGSGENDNVTSTATLKLKLRLTVK